MKSSAIKYNTMKIILIFFILIIQYVYSNKLYTKKNENFNLIIDKPMKINVNLTIELYKENLKYNKNMRFKRSVVNTEYKFPTVNDAIEAFRKNLIEKENNIGGIIDTPYVIYRFFNLKYSTRTCEIPIRCSYQSDFLKRSLNIYCTQYKTNVYNSRYTYNKDYMFERNYDQSSNNIGNVDISDYQQTLSMTIT